MKFFRFVLSRSAGARRVLLGAVLVGMVSGGSSVGLLALIHKTLERHGDGIPLARLGLLFAGLAAVVTAARISSLYILSRLGQGMVRELRLKLSHQILRTPLARLEELGPHRLLATLTDDINSLSQALVFVPVVAISGTIVLGCLGYLAWLNFELFLMLLVAFVVGVVTYQVPARIGVRRFEASREEQDVLFGHFRALTEGAKELKLHRRRRSAFVRLLEETTEVLRRLRVNAALIYGSAAAWGHLLFFVVIGLLLYARPAFIHASPETLVGYTLVLLYMMTPLQTFLDNVPVLSRADVAVAKVLRLGFSLAQEQEEVPVDGGGVVGTAAPWHDLELAGVEHTYHREGTDRDFTLGPLDLHLEAGEVLFLVGGNGSGKTTLAKILVGLYAPEGGEIRLDGRPLAAGERDDYRQLFSVVFADFYLFDRLLGLEAPNVDEQARAYLEELQIAHKVEVTDGDLSTIDLSQGQRKRLALLVAYLEDRPIYVFDEWAADQDPVFKEIFYRQILAELKRRGKAVVVISHDDRYFHLADRLVKLEDGQLLYDGRYEEVAAPRADRAREA